MIWSYSYYISYAVQCGLQDQTLGAIVKLKMFLMGKKQHILYVSKVKTLLLKYMKP